MLEYSQSAHLPHTEEYIPLASQRFWDDGFVKPAPSFSDQIKLIEDHPDEACSRQNIITAKPTSIVGPISKNRSALYFTERQGLLNLSYFLDVVTEQAENDPVDSISYAESQKNLEHARGIKEELAYLGKQEYDEACNGIAAAWRNYVIQSPDHIINVFAPNSSGDESYCKSYEIVLQDIICAFNQLNQDDLEAITRLRLGPEIWQDTDKAKLIIVDDWAISGYTIRTNLQHAINAALRAGLPELADKAEVNLLMARGDYLYKGVEMWNPGGQVCPVRGYFSAGAVSEESRGTPISGSHSSVDYNFESPLSWMREYLQSKRIYGEIPLLADIQRTYQEERQVYDPETVVLLGRLADLNRIHDQLQTDEAKVREAIRSKSLPFGSPEKEIDELCRIYPALMEAKYTRNVVLTLYDEYLMANYY
jgi:hypothetical protein